MITPVRLQLSRRKGFNLQAASIAVNGLAAVNCARPGAYGNTFWPGVRRRDCTRCGRPVVRVRDVVHAVELHKAWLLHWMYLEPSVYAWLAEIAGRNLACWCPPPEPCHVDNLLAAANGAWDEQIERWRAVAQRRQLKSLTPAATS